MSDRRLWLLEVGLLLLILIAAAYLRLSSVAGNPGWYADEGTHLLIAQDMVRGQQGYMAVGQSTLLLAKMPLFEALLAWLMRSGREGISVLRQLTASLGILTVAALYFCSRRISGDRWLALLAAALLAGYRQAVLYSRFGFSYNLLAPLVLLAYLGFWEYGQPAGRVERAGRGWLLLAAGAVGTGILVDLWMLALVLPFVGLVLLRHGRDLAWSLPLLMLPAAIYIGWMQLQAPEAFWFDLSFTFARVTALDLAGQLRSLVFNYTALFSQDQWLAMSLVGLALLRPVKLGLLTALMLLFPIFFIGRTAALISLSAYYMIPLLPLVALGVASLLRHGLPWVAERCAQWIRFSAGRRRRPRPGATLTLGPLWSGVVRVGLLLLAFAPFVADAFYLANQVVHHMPTAVDPFLIEPADARRVAAIINQRASPQDLVLASPGFAWLLQGRSADPQMALAYRGQATPHLPANIPADRFRYRPDMGEARYVVIDNYWRNWAAVNVAGVSQMIQAVEAWPLLHQAGAIELYCNPALPGC